MIPLLTALKTLAMGEPCQLTGGSFLTFPTWYKYLPGQVDGTGACSPALNSIGDIWLILAAVIEIMLRIAALAAVGYIIYAGFEYLRSNGEPDKTARARESGIYALVGLIVAITATGFINLIAGAVS